jgi:protein-arginine deiminase
MRSLYPLILTLAVALAACASEDGSTQWPGPGPGPNGSPDAGVDCTGDDCVSPDPDAAVDPAAWIFEDAFGIANLDDDDASGSADWYEPYSSSDNDFSELRLAETVMESLDDGDVVRLSLTGDTDLIRIYIDDQQVLGDGMTTQRHDIESPSGELVLLVEFGAYNAAAELDITRLDDASAEIDSFTSTLRASPLIINHHLQPSEHVYALSVDAQGYSNASMLAEYVAVLGDNFTGLNANTYAWDVWVQDEIEFATSIGSQGQRLDIVIDSIRDRGLDPLAENLVGNDADIISDTWGSSFDATTFDSFGNLEASPPVTVGGTKYPFGRIYYGSIGSWGMDDVLADFLAAQEIQEPFALDTSWLCVGHVDEYSTFVPDPSSEKGFKLLLADVPTAYAILDGLDPNASLPLYGNDYGYGTVGALTGDTALRALNQDLQSDYLDPIKAKFKSELGLTDADIILIPTLFETVSRCGGGVAALMPGMVNLIVATGNDNDTHLFLPDPFFREFADQSTDPLINHLAEVLPSELELHFVDNWDVYHLGLGEVHCGTNVRRTPIDEWWMTSEHLLGGGW